MSTLTEESFLKFLGRSLMARCCIYERAIAIELVTCQQSVVTRVQYGDVLSSTESKHELYVTIANHAQDPQWIGNLLDEWSERTFDWLRNEPIVVSFLVGASSRMQNPTDFEFLLHLRALWMALRYEANESGRVVSEQKRLRDLHCRVKGLCTQLENRWAEVALPRRR